MLYYLSHWDPFCTLPLFKYITFRAMGAFLTAFMVTFLCGPSVIRCLKHYQKEGQPIRQDGPATHLLTKQGTPTMGGVLILLGLMVSILLWAHLDNAYVLWIVWTTLGLGALGAADDFVKLSKKNPNGLSAKWKFLIQWSITLTSAFWIWFLLPPTLQDALLIPFFKQWVWHLGWLFPLLAAFVIVGTSNAVNLTDGLDGLAIGPVMIASGVFAVIAYVVGHSVFAPYLQLPFVPHVGELTVLCAALVGSGLGFLWYNAPPAAVFMGDTGSLSVGGFLGGVAVATKHELVLALVGGLFVVEALSVILQVAYFKMTRKRIFLMAPIHHHFEKKGWAEATIVFRFWTIALILGVLGLATLKLR